MNTSDYDDPNEIHFNTIEDAAYLIMMNGISFIIVNSLNLWEHQSTSEQPERQVLRLSEAFGSMAISKSSLPC